MKNIIACMTNSYGPYGPYAAIEHVRYAGLEYIEIPIRTAGVASMFREDPLLTTDSALDDLKRVDRMLLEGGVGVVSCNVTSGNPLDPAVVELIERKIDIASHFGVSIVVGNAGEAEPGEPLETLYRNLRQIGDYAAERGITYCFETHPGICQTPEGMCRTMQDLDHENLKLNFDTGNILYYNENIDGAAALKKVGKFVRSMHLKDTRGKFQEWNFPALGAGGAVDFRRTLEILQADGFRGPYTIEVEGIQGEAGLSQQQYQQRVEDSVEHLKLCGYFQ